MIIVEYTILRRTCQLLFPNYNQYISGRNKCAALVAKQVDIPHLTATIVNEFIKQIFVYAPGKSGTKRTQRVRITFDCLDEFGLLNIGKPDITETTYGCRKTA